MASQVAHIVYAQKYLKKNPFTNLDEDLFLLGCVFPDIRRIDKAIKRKDTHLRFYPVDLDFSGLNSFEAGWKFHLYCDMRREEVLNKYNFYSLPGADACQYLSAKLYEDEIIYGDYEKWEKVRYMFNCVPCIETGIGVSYEVLSLWYAIIASYIKENPNDKSVGIFLSKQNSLCQSADEVVSMIQQLRKNEIIGDVLKKVQEEII